MSLKKISLGKMFKLDKFVLKYVLNHCNSMTTRVFFEKFSVFRSFLLLLGPKICSFHQLSINFQHINFIIGIAINCSSNRFKDFSKYLQSFLTCCRKNAQFSFLSRLLRVIIFSSVFFTKNETINFSRSKIFRKVSTFQKNSNTLSKYPNFPKFRKNF